MDFDHTDEQRLLKDSVDRFVAEHYDFEARRAYRAQPEGWSREIWGMFAQLGLLGLPFAESDGGFGGSAVDVALVMQAFGRTLVVEPYSSGVVAIGALLNRLASPEQRASLVPAITAGELLIAYAQVERTSRYDLNSVETQAVHDGGRWLVSGAKGLVLHGDTADRLLVTARAGGAVRDREGIGLFLVDATDRGVSRRGYPTQDGMRAAEISFDGVPAEPVGEPGHALPLLEWAQDEVVASTCAEAVGAMEAAHAATVDYLKTRKQFGRAIGENQVLQHRAVDMYVSLEQARSMAMFATMMATESDAVERQRAMHAAKVQIGRSARHIGQEAVQLHGGIGVTMEYSVGHYLKRLTVIENSLGDTQTHLSALARLGGLLAA